MMRDGKPGPAGSFCDDGGVNFAVYSGTASAMELCLFDEHGNETGRHFLPRCTQGMWHGYLPGCKEGQRYGYRAHGPWDPTRGLRFNPAKLLLDPYARRMDGGFRWSPAVFDFLPGDSEEPWRKSEQDSAPFVPRCMVSRQVAPQSHRRPRIPWRDLIIYEANVRGYTMRHPGLAKAERGTFRGLSNAAILEYIKSLGVTALELMPVHAFVDESFLVKQGLRNYWGYNSVQFFVPDARFGCRDGIAEFREMVRAIHDAGIEVILDVAYNHTGEGNERGPTLSFRGLDNVNYYRSAPGEPGRLMNHTGCGNSINADHPAVQTLILDSLRYWHREMGVDGFRFDLATILARTSQGFDKSHPLLRRITHHPELRGAKLIAEPWDPGPDGYHLGGFPSSWAEWNDRYRDTVRRFWRGDPGQAGRLAQSVHGSSDLFEPGGRAPSSSINYITCHDGFTLLDLVSYKRRHNRANGQDNQDGHKHNFSSNHGVEGPSADTSVVEARFLHRLNLLATLLFSQGTPMILAGDEFGHTQSGNNNAFAQDNETGWLDWTQMDRNEAMVDRLRQLTKLRKELPMLRLPYYLHGRSSHESRWYDIRWLGSAGETLLQDDWHSRHQVTLLLTRHDGGEPDSAVVECVAVLFHSAQEQLNFSLPPLPGEARWTLRFCSSTLPPAPDPGAGWKMAGPCVALAHWIRPHERPG